LSVTTLIVIDQSPYSSWAGREALDMAFSQAAFDQPVSVLFAGAGVNWLRAGQATANIQQKSVEKHLSAAAVFGVQALYADASACALYGLTEKTMMAGVIISGNISELIRNHKHTAFAG
jgi:tRNA 2-thiouridine synthesizing protein C